MAPLDKGVNAVKPQGYCPICNSRLGGEQGIECPTHGVVNPVYKGHEDYMPDAPGKQTPDNVFIPTATPLTAAVLDKNQLDGHPDEKGDETIDYLKEWRTDEERHFDGVGDVNSDKKTLVIVEPSLELDDEGFGECEHGDICKHIINTWEDLCGDDR